MTDSGKQQNTKKSTSEQKTLFMSVLMSAPGPLVVGLGLIVGKSSTQLSDFFRRTAELLGIISAYVIYKITNKDGKCDECEKARLESLSNMIVGAMMFLAGSILMILAFTGNDTETGNVIPGLSIAILGVIANTFFWIKYTSLNKAQPNAIIAVQSRLYRAKSLVDGCVTIALLSVAIWPGTDLSYMLDKIGSVIVAAYLAFCGIKTVYEASVKKRENSL